MLVHIGFEHALKPYIRIAREHILHKLCKGSLSACIFKKLIAALFKCNYKGLILEPCLGTVEKAVHKGT